MADPARRSDALLTDHFTYTPLSLIDDIINAVNTIIYQALDAIEDGLLKIPAQHLGFASKPPPTDDDESHGGEKVEERAREEIEEGVHRLETLLESTVDKSFDKFEIYVLRNILTVEEDVGGWVRLGHYAGLELPLKENTPTPERIAQLRRRKHETAKLNALLKARQAGNARLVQEVKGLTSSSSRNEGDSAAVAAASSLAFLKGGGKGEQNLTTQAQFATSQLPALRELMGRLRPRAEKLRTGRGGMDVDVGSNAEERRRYIESGVRRVVDRSGVADSEAGLNLAMGEGRRNREDVEMLEGVVGTGIGATERRREEQGDEMEE
ncbi:MAG: hypothetical protein OHK93_006951 [Ramalina farinacea]|uniref:Mis12 domain-containing protein n=1 Tax=Ramalina farinacea TaxID=258253 RepID=A0AA43TV25_9LECA|nr:hypothetical protein [Ramalina farinacea]